MPLAVFRADAGTDLGGGHLVRCLALADALARRGWRCVFACNEGAAATIPALRTSAHEVEELAPDQAADPSALRARWPGGAQLLVVDHYRLDRAFEAGCRPWTKRILAIDDLASRRHDGDYVLDQTPARAADDYRELVPPACKVLAGASYALLRPEFARAREEAMRHRGGRMAPGRILVSVGASDPARATEAALNAVRESGLGVPVDVIVGAADQRREAIKESLARLAPSSRLHVDPSVQAMVELMMQADLAVGAGGVSALERCCLGLPSLLLVLAGNQAGNAAALRGMGAVRIAALTEGAEHPPLSRALLDVAREPASIAGMSRAAAAVCDGLGAGRVAAILDEAA